MDGKKKLAKLKRVSTSVERQSHLSVTISKTAPKVDTEQGEIWIRHLILGIYSQETISFCWKYMNHSTWEDEITIF